MVPPSSTRELYIVRRDELRRSLELEPLIELIEMRRLLSEREIMEGGRRRRRRRHTAIYIIIS